MSNNRMGTPIEILLVEDNPDDIALMVEAFKRRKIRNNLNVARDGMEALDFLRRNGSHADAVQPDLILLDLNLPKKDGREVLEEIKDDEGLKHIPVVILTTSSAEEDILKTYRLHANCYITKPVGLQEFSKIVDAIENFWFTIVKLPPR